MFLYSFLKLILKSSQWYWSSLWYRSAQSLRHSFSGTGVQFWTIFCTKSFIFVNMFKLFVAFYTNKKPLEIAVAPAFAVEISVWRWRGLSFNQNGKKPLKTSRKMCKLNPEFSLIWASQSHFQQKTLKPGFTFVQRLFFRSLRTGASRMFQHMSYYGP